MRPARRAPLPLGPGVSGRAASREGFSSTLDLARGQTW